MKSYFLNKILCVKHVSALCVLCVVVTGCRTSSGEWTPPPLWNGSTWMLNDFISDVNGSVSFTETA